MEIQKRIENALRVSKSIKNGQLDSKNKYDLLLHLTEAVEEVEKLSTHKTLVRLDSLEIGEKFRYNLNDVGVFQVVEKEDGDWIGTIRIQSSRKSGDFPWTEIYPI